MAAYGGPAGRYYRPAFFGGMSFFPPVVKALLISNVAIWLMLDFLLPGIEVSGVRVFVVFREYLQLWPLGSNFWPWQLVTYLFLHAGFWHIFFNMLALWLFGMQLEHTWGSRKFLIYYLLCGIGAGAANLLIAPLVGPTYPTVGASGAIFGILVAFGMLFPDQLVYLYMLFPIKAKYVVAGYIGLELFLELQGANDGIARLAHLGGAAVGFVYMLTDLNLLPFRRWWTQLRSGRAGLWRGRKWSQRADVREAKFYDIQTGRPLSDDDQDNPQEVIDAILDKISKGGYQSLSEREKKILFEASKKIH